MSGIGSGGLPSSGGFMSIGADDWATADPVPDTSTTPSTSAAPSAAAAPPRAAATRGSFDPAAMPTLKKGDKDVANVLVLQNTINVWRKRMGLRPIGTDGDFGRVTRNALKRFERAMGIDADGKADPDTWKALAKMLPDAAPVRETNLPTAPPPFDASEMPTLRARSKDAKAVTTLQTALNAWRATRNRSGVGVDGDFGATTRMAVLEFQRALGLPTTGIVGANEWEKLSALQNRDLTSAQGSVSLETPWISQYDKTGRVKDAGDTACFRATQSMVKEYLANTGRSATLLGPFQRIDVGRRETKTGDVLSTQGKIENGRRYIDRALDAGLPVIVGISHQSGSDYNWNKVTDHFVVITGRGRDDDGKLYYTLHDPSTTKRELGIARFYPDAQGNLVRDGKVATGLIRGRRLEISEVRTWKELP